MFRRRQDKNNVAGDSAKQRPGSAKRKYKRRKRESVPSFSQIDEEVTMDHLRIVTSRAKRRHISRSTEPTVPVWQFQEGENFDPYPANGFTENRLPSTQRWRNLPLFNNGAQDDPLLISEEIFRENVNDLLNGIDECAENPAQWSRDRTNSYFAQIQRFLDSWKRQLMKENEKMDLEVLLVKRRFENKHDSVTNRLNILTGVLHESMCFMEFSEFQKRSMQSKVEDLNHVRSSVGERGNLVLSESALAIELETANGELIEARRQAVVYSEELIEARRQAEEYSEELIEARRQADGYREELIQARRQADGYREELIEARRQAEEYREEQIEARKQADGYSEELIQVRRQTDGYSEELIEARRQADGYKGELIEARRRADGYREELIEARKQADEYSEELRQRRDNFEEEANLKLNELTHARNLRTQVDPQDKCLQDKEEELQELKKQIDKGAEKQMNTETELIRTREQFQSFALKSLEITHTKQMELKKILYDIQTSLRKKNPEYKPSVQSENETLSQDKLFKDITALIENNLQWVSSDSNCKKSTTEVAVDSGSTSLRVSEYELHLVTLISSFLKVTPFPVNSSYIYSYVANIDNVVDLEFVEHLLHKFPALFKKVAVAPGSMDKNWTYLDLKPVITI